MVSKTASYSFTKVSNHYSAIPMKTDRQFFGGRSLPASIRRMEMPGNSENRGSAALPGKNR